MGRPTKLSPKVRRAITSALMRGNTRETAAVAAGIGRATLTVWLARGRSNEAIDAPYRALVAAIEKAEALAIQASVGVIRHAARDTWQAAAWWLERRYPEEWGRKDRMEIEHLLNREAERIAGETGLTKEEIIAETERILAGSR